ncbi:MAG TPA: T9SS type A sorting domain-containing protein, partial [Mariniphaga anaerophila]|nr:T9SS type A sorting domain-containing protein [Mariniphaga anaerophila]
YNHTDVASICGGESFVFGKQTLTTAGEYEETFTSVHGCDSTVMLTLTAFPVYDVFETVTVYEDDLPYQFGTQSLTVEGEFIGNFYSVTGCDSIVTLSLIVKPEDNIPPDIVCNPIEVSLNSSGQYVLVEADISTILEGTTDNDSEFDELLIEVTPSSFSCEHAGLEIPVLVTVTDIRGNENICSTTVKVKDQTLPRISCKNINVILDENGLASLSKNELYTSAFDACGIANVTVSRQQFSCSYLGTNNVIVRATDNNNNSRTCTSVVTVTDNLSPVFEPVADQIAEADAGECFAKIDYPEIIVYDNCNVEELFLIEGLGPDAEFPIGTSRERWVATDGSGNSDTLSFEVIVSANYTEPSLNTISDIIVSEGTETVSVQISGIFDGSLCENLPLEFDLVFTNKSLVETFSVNYFPGESTAELLLVLTENSIGESLITLILKNTQTNEEFSTEFSLVVSAVNHPPFLVEAPENMEMKAGDTLIVLLSSEKGVIFDDTDENDSLYFSLAMEDGSEMPEWMRFMNDSLVAHPSISDTGCYKLLLIATDLKGGEAYCPLTLCVSIPSRIQYMSDFEIKVYPNPTSGIVYIDFSKYTGQRAEISVADILGKEILRKVYSSEERIEVDLSDRATGIYFLKVLFNRQEINHKLIIKRNP